MGWFGISLKMWLLRRPQVMTALFSLFKFLPWFSPLKYGFVLDASTARDVLDRGGDFEVTPTSAPKMLAGDFIHGMDKFPRYELDRTQLQAILSDINNLTRARQLAWLHTSETLRTVFGKPSDYLGKKMDLFAEFVQPIVTQTIFAFYGLHMDQLQSSVLKGEGQELAWRLVRLIGTMIAIPHPAPFGRLQVAQDACFGDAGLINQLKLQIAAEMKQYPRGRPLGEGTVLQQLIAYEVANGSEDPVDKIVKRLFGILATSTAINKLFINILKELLRRQAQEVKLKGSQGETLMDELLAFIKTSDGVLDVTNEKQLALRSRLRGYLLELLRFNIAFPGLPRNCPRSTTVKTADGTSFLVKKNTEVTALLPAVMFDNQEWSEPDKFCPHRNQEQYMHFGAGQHHCLGSELSLILLEEMFMQFLTIDGLKQARILRIVNDGPTYEAVHVRIGTRSGAAT